MVQATVLNGHRPKPHDAYDPSTAPRRRLLVLTSKPKGISPGQRFRLEQWAPHAEARHGIEMDFVPFESPRLTEILYHQGRKPEKAFWVLRDFARRAADVVRARRYDGVVVFREAALIGPAVYERLFAWTQTPMFFDFDDAIWMPTQVSAANGIFTKLHFFGKTSTICKLSSAVLAGNEYLATYARARNPNVYVLPTSIELEKYPVIPEPEQDDPLIVSWSGSVHTLRNFEEARPALERVAKQRRLVVKVICNKPPARPIEGAENLFIPWREEGEAEAIGAAHIGIMPLPDDDYHRGKCGLKALQFMATGRPVILSPVGMNSDLIQSGKNGFLARTTDEWVDALERLGSSRELRARLGAAGRKTVEEGYSAGVVSDRFGRAVQETLARRG